MDFVRRFSIVWERICSSWREILRDCNAGNAGIQIDLQTCFRGDDDNQLSNGDVNIQTGKVLIGKGDNGPANDRFAFEGLEGER
jgi:hypothetical protein